MSETKPGMSSLNEDDVRRICREELIDFSDIVASAIRACGKVYSIESAVKKRTIASRGAECRLSRE